MNLSTKLIISFGLGISLGFFYFYALWLTVRRLPEVQRKGLWLSGSFLIRMSAVLAGFYLVMGDRWETLLACLLGFMLMRVLFARRLRPETEKSSKSKLQESSSI